MLFKLNDKVLFRRYEDHGYISDNSEFGYRMLNDNTPILEEKFVSLSGAVMLSELTREFQELDEIVKKIFSVFVDVDYDTLKQDTLEFFSQFAAEGYLDSDHHFENANNFSESNDDIIFNHSQKNYLRSIHFEIANACNERCVHCYIPEQYKTNRIDSELFYKILNEGSEMNIIHVTLTGGEPMLHPEFLSFLKKCRELDLSVNILSNLTLLNDKMISEMKKNPLLSVQTSLYSMIPEIHDDITKFPGSFEKTKLGILRLLEAGIPLQISCQVMKQNRKNFVDVVKWGNEKNIPVAFNYIIFGEYDRSQENLKNRLSITEVSEAVEDVLSRNYAESLKNAAEAKLSMNLENPICSVCKDYFGVTAEGYAFPCAGWQNKKLGNLRDKTVKEIWESLPEVDYLRNIMLKDFKKCVNCENRGYCAICMMSNANENPDGDIFRIGNFHCDVAAVIRSKIEEYFK